MNNKENRVKETENELIFLISKFAQYDADFTTDLPELSFYRRSQISAPMPCVYGLGVAVVLQGKKRLIVGDETIEYGPGQSLLTTIDLPGVSYISQASPSAPYLSMLLRLDTRVIAQLAAEMDLSPNRQEASHRALSFQELDTGLRDTLHRLVMLLDEPPILRSHLSPLLQKEIYVRLLAGPHGTKLLQLVSSGTPARQIAQTVTWIKQNFHKHIEIDSLAALAHMSGSTFRQHFRAVCGMSPLQFIKQIRLQEARQLLLTGKLDAGEAALRVGYESPSQFTREYKRLFGNPPLRDLKILKEDITLAV